MVCVAPFCPDIVVIQVTVGGDVVNVAGYNVPAVDDAAIARALVVYGPAMAIFAVDTPDNGKGVAPSVSTNPQT